MNFAALPPEINSALMYAGPGSGPMLVAAAAWDGLAIELRSAATAYASTMAGLTGASWLGPSSATMAAAAAPYVRWLAATATQAEQTATQAKAVAAAYEAAFAITVPPPVIAANRAQLAALVATNVFGQNAPAIAATEAHYGQMWAQDVTTMYGYAASAITAAKLTPFAAAPPTTNPTASAAQGAASALSALAAPAQAEQTVSLASLIPVLALAVSATSTSVSPSIAGAAWNAAATNNRILVGNTEGILDVGNELHLMEREMLEILRAGRLRSGLTAAESVDLGAGLRSAPVSAATAQAVSAGKLSVPLSWAAAAPEIRTAAYSLPTAGVRVATAAAEANAGSAFSQMALAGMGGSALAGSVSRGQREHPVTTPAARVKSEEGEPAESTQELPDSPVAELVAGIRQLSELRDSGLLTVEEFTEQKQRLLYRPLR